MEKSYNVPAVDKAVTLMQILCEATEPMSLTEISKAVGTNNNMAYRILRTLQARGWVIQEQPGPKYHMSLLPFHHTSKPASRLNLVVATSKPMNEFWNKHGECCYLGVLDGDRVLYVDTREQVGGPIKISVNTGGRYLLHIAAPGKVLLTGNEEATKLCLAGGLERFTENTFCTEDSFRKELQITKDRGYAFDDEEGARGLICMSVPIFDSEKKVVGSFGISVLTANYKDLDEMFEALGEDVIEVGRQASAALGYVE